MNFKLYASETIFYSKDYTLTLDEIKECIKNASWEDNFKKEVLNEIETTNTTKHAQKILEEALASGMLDYPSTYDCYDFDHFQIEEVIVEGTK